MTPLRHPTAPVPPAHAAGRGAVVVLVVYSLMEPRGRTVGGMLEARKFSLWRDRYEIVADGLPLSRWDGRVWRNGGTFDLAERRYGVKSNVWGTRFEMIDEAGMIVAVADRVGRKWWTVEASGRTYRFQRASWWRSEELLVADGRPVGYVRGVSRWRRDAVADLPDLPLPLQVFVVVVVLTMWDAQAAGA